MKLKVLHSVSLILLIYLLSGIILYIYQEKFLFFPNKNYIYFEKYSESIILYNNRKIPLLHNITNNCGNEIIVYFHGNAGNIYDQGLMYDVFSKIGICFVAVEYPGYGTYEGKITTINDLYISADQVINRLFEKGHTADDMYMRGYSLGGGLAAYAGATYDVKGIVLQSTYVDLKSVAKTKYSMFPVSLLFKYKLEVSSFLDSYGGGVLIFHGKEDLIVPYSHALKNSSINKDFALVPFIGGHDDISTELFANEFWNMFRNTLNKGEY